VIDGRNYGKGCLYPGEVFFSSEILTKHEKNWTTDYLCGQIPNPPKPDPKPHPDDGGDGDNTGLIIGLVVGGLALVVGVFVFLNYRKKKQ